LTESPIAVREGTPRDFAQVAHIQWDCAEAAQWPVGDYSAFRLFVAEMDGAVVGFCWWRQTSPEEAELLNLGVAQEARRKGVGTALLKAVRKASTGEIFLEVAENNPGAMALYKGAEWVEIGTRPAYYPNGIHAIVMKKGSW
jgi:ribosomal protein S18 acetylase RimI-like enzyme